MVAVPVCYKDSGEFGWGDAGFAELSLGALAAVYQDVFSCERVEDCGVVPTTSRDGVSCSEEGDFWVHFFT